MQLDNKALLARQLVRVTGADRLNLLQKLVSQDLTGLGAATPAAYTLLLTPQGKYLHDFFVLWTPDALFLDTPASQTEALVTTLNKYKLRSDVQFAVLPQMQIRLRAVAEQGFLVVHDPRADSLGWRIWQESSAEIDSDYAEKLTLAGIVEPSLELISGTSMPIEFGLQNTQAISFTKGCYLGQELTARMQHRDLAKRVVIAAKFEGNQDVVEGFESVVRSADGTEIGIVLRACAPIFLLHVTRDFADQKTFSVQRSADGRRYNLVRC